jgi:Survival protein SurE
MVRPTPKKWYHTGTSAACTLVGLDHVLPEMASITTPYLLVSGPNSGDNIDTFEFTGSGNDRCNNIPVLSEEILALPLALRKQRPAIRI